MTPDELKEVIRMHGLWLRGLASHELRALGTGSEPTGSPLPWR
jgi:hypothetical protein